MLNEDNSVSFIVHNCKNINCKYCHYQEPNDTDRVSILDILNAKNALIKAKETGVADLQALKRQYLEDIKKKYKAREEKEKEARKAKNIFEAHDKFKISFSKIFIVDQLDYQRKKAGFHLVSDREKLLEIIESTKYGVAEYRINITPEQLDSILKLSVAYSYRGNNGVLRLRKPFTIKPGVIYLFPVYPLPDSHSFIIRAVGCQKVEMPAIQLLHLLPDYNDKQEYFHWVPNEVSQKLCLERYNITGVSDALLLEQNMIKKADADIINSPKNPCGLVRIVPMDEVASNFYAMYGNIGQSELKQCQSLEVDALTYLKQLKKQHQDSYTSKDTSDKRKLLLLAAINTLDKMIEHVPQTVSDDKPGYSRECSSNCVSFNK